MKKIDETKTSKVLRLRNKALIILLYYSARRISEIVGRKLKLENGTVDVWRGVCVKDFRFDIREDREIMIMNIRILKKGRAKKESIRHVYREVLIYSDWALMDYFLLWFGLQQSRGSETKIFNIGRSRAYQIISALDPRIIGAHWFRHQRLSHFAEYLSPFELNERIGFWEGLDPAVSYVHGRVGNFLDAGDKITSREGER